MDNQKEELEYCSDAIAMYRSADLNNGKYVLVERLSFPCGLAFVGGRRDYIDGKLESSQDCIAREFKEETGLDLVIEGYVGNYDDESRDPRGPKESQVYFGYATGEIKDEIGKTKVVLLSLSELVARQDELVFDHKRIFWDYIWNDEI
jgi:ADP-ribose pyrophosphatase YjhB (NUDIX family)